MKYSTFLNLIEKLRIKVSETEFKIEDNKKIKVTISIGAKEIKDYLPLNEAIKQADDNLYKAKETGRNKLIG